jgi:hypothetical protein
MRKLAVVVLFFVAVGVRGQGWQKMWDYRYGGTGDEKLFSFQRTTDGGYILGGYSTSDSTGDVTQHNQFSSFDFWIVKIDSLGVKQWDKRFGGNNTDQLYCLYQTTDGGYILGGFSNTDSSGDVSQHSRGGSDYWIVKINSLGIKQWDKRFGGTQNDYFLSLQQTADGGYIAGGWTQSDSTGDMSQHSRGGNDYWIVKTDALGNKQWDKRFGGIGNDLLSALHQTTDGGYILGGYSLSGIGGDKTQPNWYPISPSYDFWVVKTDLLGIKQWDYRFGGFGTDILNSLQQTTDGGYILAGTSSSGVNGDVTQASYDTCGTCLGGDFWMVKIDSLGIKQWDKRFGGVLTEDEFGNISLTSDGGYLLAGTSYSPISGEKSENNLGSEQTWIIKTDSLGAKQWDKTIFTTGHDETGFAIQLEKECYVIANYTRAGIGGYKTQSNWDTTLNWYDYWVVKLCDSTLTTFENQISNFQFPISIYPNPATSNSTITLTYPFSEEKSEVIIYDVQGREVVRYALPAHSKEVKVAMPLLTSGMYVARLSGSSERSFQRGNVKFAVQ